MNNLHRAILGVSTFLLFASTAFAQQNQQPQDPLQAMQMLMNGLNKMGAPPSGPSSGPAPQNMFDAMTQAADEETKGPVKRFVLGRGECALILAATPALPPSHPAVNYVRKVGTTLAMRAAAPYHYRGWTFIVLNTNELNAYAVPGGFILITAGMLKFMNNEDELAAVLGHEFGHMDFDHSYYAFHQKRSQRLFQQAAGGKFDAMMNDMHGAIVQGYNIEVEAEADIKAIDLLATTGYAHSALKVLLDRFKQIKNNYGGANYPVERTKLIDEYVKARAFGPVTPISPERTARFQAMKRSL